MRDAVTLQSVKLRSPLVAEEIMDANLRINEIRRIHRDDRVERRNDPDAWKRIAEGAQTELEKWAENRRDRRRARPRSVRQDRGKER